MSQFENPALLMAGHQVTVEEVHALMGASTPHFAMQLRVRIGRLIRDLPAEHPARLMGELEIARLNEIAYDGEVRGTPPEEGLPPLASVNADEIALFAQDAGH
ncbi:MAG: hypothetical protein KGL16_05045 [Acidobacteriota bacterium]|nr:hypothetical protein [Acidobacteriota bacterium]